MKVSYHVKQGHNQISDDQRAVEIPVVLAVITHVIDLFAPLSETALKYIGYLAIALVALAIFRFLITVFMYWAMSRWRNKNPDNYQNKDYVFEIDNGMTRDTQTEYETIIVEADQYYKAYRGLVIKGIVEILIMLVIVFLIK
ncbi:hypothetical protein [Weissella cibaria]|uniref:DUF3899 domain-containing protein n=1 Tax=Weissella cibaria TaxID=137591 RepID=A0A0D1M6J7_9LACO|nr:hypothetical protein [Weissella cibaria]KIU23666.1 hypothetical protein ab3b_01402 [Weissella cibaria]